ncbi:uncharacterized protein LOC129593238 [Paramacrobiotus metropolitanus]|uniref:uncharacterized protein LOC129593238 n=1 Tax=Paramacrobiotus metropolitanus TaxID=2943436 RepID=UPI002445FDCB|nr:uncharacterized protein LOC129593238 [Paramacrobiotus metropolitanus]
MVLGWFQTPLSRDRANSFSRHENAAEPAIIQEQLQNRINQADPAPAQPQPQRRRSIFERRVSLGSDPFSREYADQTGDLWVAECDQGDAAHIAEGHLRTEALTRPVPLGADEFSREYFDATEDNFVAETDLGDSGYVRRNSQTVVDYDSPEVIRRIGEMLRRPVRVGHDTFSQEYAREFEDMWQATAGKGPSGKYTIVERVMSEYQPDNRNAEQGMPRRQSIFSQ